MAAFQGFFGQAIRLPVETDFASRYHEYGWSAPSFYDTWVLGKKNLADKFTADLLIEGHEGELTTILYVNGANKSEALFNGKTVPCSTVFPGCCEVVLPKNSAGILEIIPGK